MQDRWAMIIDHTRSYLLNYHSPVVGPHCEHGEAEAEAEEGEEHRVQVVQVERGHRVELQKKREIQLGQSEGRAVQARLSLKGGNLICLQSWSKKGQRLGEFFRQFQAEVVSNSRSRMT